MKYMIGSFIITVSVAVYTQDIVLGVLAYGILLTLNGILEEVFLNCARYITCVKTKP